MAYSGGKDSILALHRLIQAGYLPKVLYTIFNESIEGGNCHSLSKKVLDRVSQSLEIPIVYLEQASSEIYQEVYPAFLKTLKTHQVDYCAFGDIFLENCKRSNARFCEQAGLEPLFPLWNINEKKIFQDFIDLGFHGIVKSVDPSRVCRCLLGHEINQTLMETLSRSDISLCGERGEYHTFVYDGPIFKQPIDFEIIGVVENRPYQTLALQ